MRATKPVTVVFLAVGLALGFTGCKSAPKKNAEQQIISREREHTLTGRLTENLDKAYGPWNDAEATRILNSIVDRLVAADPNYSDVAGTKVHLLSPSAPYFAPGLGKVIYISRGALAGIAYENELAVLLGTQLHLVKERATARNLATLQGQELGESLILLPTAPPAMQKDYLSKGWFEAGGLFDFGDNVYLKAEQEGVQLAYKAKYDPRGAITLAQHWLDQGKRKAQSQAVGKILPNADERLKTARDEVAKLSPLRDPIVKSRAFEELQSRLQVKKAKITKKKKSS